MEPICMDVKSCFLGKIRKMSLICHDELAQRVVEVKDMGCLQIKGYDIKLHVKILQRPILKYGIFLNIHWYTRL